MIIGIPKEVKNHEYRVSITPSGVKELVSAGHQVNVETQAGVGIGFTDEHYNHAGATVLPCAEAIFATSELIVKVKEPQKEERALLKSHHILFTYLHLAPDPEQTLDLINSQATCIAYETITGPHGRLPLLAPMSEVAGRMALQAGAQALERSRGGSGILLSGVPGVEPAKVVIIGGGVVGANAARIAIGMRADVTLLDNNLRRLRQLDEEFAGQAKLIFATKEAIEQHVISADLVIGAVLVAGAAAPKLVTAEHIRKMQIGSAIVDVAIDQGGCIETSRPTTHTEPTFIVDGVVHYCVANMPGAVAKTSTLALSNATLPYILKLANKGLQNAVNEDAHLLNGLNVMRGKVTNREVAHAQGLEFVSAKTFFS